MGSDVQKLFGVKRDKRSPQHKSEIEAANAMKPVDFSTSHGSQGVTNPNYAEYVKLHPDLIANYNAMGWKDKGVTLAEYGAMHWNKHGRAEGRTMPGIGGGGGGGEEAGYGGGLSGPLGGWFQPENIYFPQLVQEYTRPEAIERPAGLLDPRNPLSYIPGAYQPGTVQGAALVPGGILEYQPPQIRTGLPTFIGNPYGPLQLPEDWESLLDLGEEEEEEDNEKPERDGGGKGDKGEDPAGGVLGSTSPAEKY